jgi:hypothetical protein
LQVTCATPEVSAKQVGLTPLNLKAKLVALGPFGADAHGFSIGFSSEERALANCKKNSPEQDCKLYVVNDQMVWVNH